MNQPFKKHYSSINSDASPFRIGRGAKSYMQAPENTQSYNYYADCFNNRPMKYTDPSEYGSHYAINSEIYWGLDTTWTGFSPSDIIRYGSFEKIITRHEKGFWEIMASDGDFGHDGANRGTSTKQDKIVGVAVIATVANFGILTEYAIGGATVYEWGLASASTVNNIDGIFTNSEGESGIQQMVDDKYKMNVGATKNLISLLSIGTGLSGSNLYQTTQSGFKFTGVATDFYSIMQPNKSYIKKK